MENAVPEPPALTLVVPEPRPLGVVLVAICWAIPSIALCIVGVPIVLKPGGFLTGLVLLSMGVFGLAAVYGVWHLTGWGRDLMMGSNVASIVLSILPLFDPSEHPSSFLSFLVFLPVLLIKSLELWIALVTTLSALIIAGYLSGQRALFRRGILR
jgi:hypothetical protein